MPPERPSGSATPAPRRLGLFGGSFDPIHIGHLVVASEALRQLDLDHVLFLPARQPPHKPGQRLAPDTDRWAMIELAIAGRSAFGLSDADLRLQGPSYSADLVERFAVTHSESDLYFIIGGDSMRDFHTWHEPHRIAAAATVAVARRPNGSYSLDDVLSLTPALNGRVVEFDMPLIEISSTSIRERASAGQPFWYQVPESVERYISERGLYSGQRAAGSEQ